MGLEVPWDCPQDYYTGSSFRLRHTLVLKIFSFMKHFCSVMYGIFFLLTYFGYNYGCPYCIDRDYSEAVRIQGTGQTQTA